MRFTLLVSILVSIAGKGTAQEAGAASGVSFSAEQIEFFEKEIRPVIAESCYDCHRGTKARVGLQLDHRNGWLRGSDYRKIVSPENPAESVVLHAVRQNGEANTPQMPEKGSPLTVAAIESLGKWIAMGLPWPEEAGLKTGEPTLKHWSFKPVEKVTLPENVGHPIDFLVRKKLQEKGISHAPKADQRVLYRRLSYDLTGLPPKYEEIEAFVNSTEPHATLWAKTVDQFLASPHYGERWARHWMDVARYSDTKGYEAGGRERRFVYSYTYRDWLIRSFNDDLPFDQFILYQLAADQLVKDWAGPEKHHLAAMGFVSLSKIGNQELVVDDRVDTTFRGLMGLTVSCARCHDHKFDPISTKEYYGLFGIFRNSLEGREPVIEDTPKTPEYEAYLKDLAVEQKKVADYLRPHLEEMKTKFPELANDEGKLKAKLGREIIKEAGELQIKVDKFVAERRMEPGKALVVVDRPKISQQNVYVRGNPSRQGEKAPAQFLKAAYSGTPEVYKNGSGRLEMAQDIASASNPLTARVMVNRVWMWHFGEGIVRTVSDFGKQGEVPDNPELLDFLANWFVENGWSIKKLHRLILTSQTWQQSADNPGASKWTLIDPENRLNWKSFRRRLDFEQMRDSYLEVAQNLDPKLYGHPETILEPPFSKRRSVYAFIDRQNLSSVFRHFDFSNPQESTGQRQKTTIPMQALFTMNSPFVMDQAVALSKNSEGAEDRVAVLYRSVFGYHPTEEDRILAESFISSYNSGSDLDRRQNLSGWSYGWGGVSVETGQVSYNPFEYWDEKGRTWRIKKEYPIKDSALSYLIVNKGGGHPGLGPEHCWILRWHAPRKMKIDISGELFRSAVGKGRSGFLVKVASSKQGIVFNQKLPVTEGKMPVVLQALEVEEGATISFIVDCDGDTAFDSFLWDPIVANSGNAGERWKMSVDFAGPQIPLSAWEAYAQALLNTNRFLFIQ